jgi:hypothetical protein
MRFSSVIVSALVFTFALAVLLWPTARNVQAQTACKPFRALGHASLPTSTRIAPTDRWGGPLYGMLGDEVLLGAFSGNDGDVSRQGVIGQGRDGAYTVCVGYPDCTDSFTYEVPNAVWPSPPGRAGFMEYFGNTARIVRGTGRFATAWGILHVSGPAVAWTVQTGKTARWNAELSGDICGVQ